MAKKSRKIKALVVCIICIIAVSLIAVLISAFMSNENDSSGELVIRRDVTVETITPEIGSIIVTGEYIGITEPGRRLTVFPKLPGEVVSVYFSVGDTVEAGDILFTMDAKDILNNIKSLEAQLAIQDATVNAARTGVSQADGSAMQGQILSATGGVQQAESAIRQAEQGLEQAQLAYDAAAQSHSNALFVFELGEISHSTLEQSQTALSNAEIVVNQATNALQQARNGHQQALQALNITYQAPAESRQRAQDALRQAQAARNSLLVSIETTTEMLDDAAVKAPISGVIDARNIDPFSMTSPQSPAFVISDSSVISVTFRVPRSAVEHMEIGDGVTLKDGNTEYAATITEISTTVSAGGLFTIEAQLDGAAAGIPGGSSVIVSATAQKAEDVLIVPLSAVHYDNGAPFVFVAENGIARRVLIEAGIFDAQYIQIISGILPDAQIISTWSSRLSDGVEIVFSGRGSAE